MGQESGINARGPALDPAFLSAATGGEWRGAARNVMGVHIDSRKIAPGNLFVALVVWMVLLACLHRNNRRNKQTESG